VEKNNFMKTEIVTYIYDKPIFRRSIPILPANQALRSRARALRKAGVLSEVIFWRQVRANTFWKIDFDRQRIIGSFIVDFYVKSLGLIIEIDGSSHNGKEEYDAMREEFLVSLDLIVFRISDYRVKHDLENVMTELENFILETFG
jgi:very-short-patch-repair endonuclease